MAAAALGRGRTRRFQARTRAAGWLRIANVLRTPRAGERSVVLIADWPDSDRGCRRPPPDAADGASSARWWPARFASAVELADQRLAVEHLEKTARLQTALYSIADLASSELDMPDMLRRVHAVVGELMYAENFFIALYDAERDTRALHLLRRRAGHRARRSGRGVSRRARCATA